MNTDTSSKNMPTGDGNPTAGNTDNAIVTNPVGTIKAVLTRLAVWLAVIVLGAGMTPTRNDPKQFASPGVDALVRQHVAARDPVFPAVRFPMCKAPDSLAAALRFLTQVGGRS